MFEFNLKYVDVLEFFKKGFYVICWSDCFWVGLFLDLVIE